MGIFVQVLGYQQFDLAKRVAEEHGIASLVRKAQKSIQTLQENLPVIQELENQSSKDFEMNQMKDFVSYFIIRDRQI